MKYNCGDIFKSPVLSQYFQEVNSEAVLELNQIALQAEFGCKVLQAILDNPALAELVPFPQTIQTEDGWVFVLNRDRYFESADGFDIELTCILKLMLLSPQERALNSFPQFQVVDWKN